MRSSVLAAVALQASLLISLQLCFVIGSVTRAKTLAPTDVTPKMRKMTSTTATAIPPTTTETTDRTTPTTKNETKDVPAAAAEAEARVAAAAAAAAAARAEWDAEERVPRSVVVVVTGLGEAERRVLANLMSVVRRLHTCNEQVYPWWRLEEDSDGCYCHLALDDSLRVLARWAREAQGLPTGVITALNPFDPNSEPAVMTLSLPDDRRLHGRQKVSDAELLQREADFIDELMGRRTTPKRRRHKQSDLYKHFKGMARARVEHEDETRKIRFASRKGKKNTSRGESEERRAANVSVIFKRRVDEGKGKMDNEIPPAKETNRHEQLKAGKHSYEYKENCPLCKSNRSHELHTVLEAPATGNESHATREALPISGELEVGSIESTTPAIDSGRDDYDFGFYTQSGGEQRHGGHAHGEHAHGGYGKHIHGEHHHGDHTHGEWQRVHGKHTHDEKHGEHVHGQHPPRCREGVSRGGVCKHRVAAAKAAKAAGKAPAMDELYDLSGLRMSSKSLHSLMMRQWLRAVDPSLEALSSVRAAGRPLELALRLATGLPRELTAFAPQPSPNLPLETQHVASGDGRAAVPAAALALLGRVEGAVPANGGLLVVRSVAPLGGERLLPFLRRLGVLAMRSDVVAALATDAGIPLAWTPDADADAFSKMDDLAGDWSGDYAPGDAFQDESRLVVVVSACPGVLDSAVHLYADGPRSDRLRNVSSLEDLVESLQNIMRETTKLNEMRGSGVEELSAVEAPRGGVQALQRVRLHVARVRVAPCAGRTCLQPAHRYCRNPTQENCVRTFKPFEVTKAPRHHKRDARQPDRTWRYLLNMSRHRRPNLERQVFGGGGEYFRMEIIPAPDPVSQPRGNSTSANASELKTEHLKGGKEVLEVSSSEVTPLATTSGPRSDEGKKDEETRITKEKLKESNDKLTTSKEGTIDVKIQEKSTMSDAITQNNILDETVNRKGRQVSFVDVKINTSLNDNQDEKHMGGIMAAKDNAELQSAKVKRQLEDAKIGISKKKGKEVNIEDSEMSHAAALNRSMLEDREAETVEPITETTLDDQYRPATNDDHRDPVALILAANKDMDTHESRLPSRVTKTAQAFCLVAVATTALSLVLLQ